MSTLETRSTESDALCAPAPATANKGFSTADIGYMVQLASEGKTEAEIAQRFNCSRQNINYHLSQFGESTRELAERYMDAALLNDAKRLETLAENGKPDEKLKAIRTKWQARGLLSDSKGDSAPQVLIQIGIQGVPQVTSTGATIQGRQGERAGAKGPNVAP